VEAAAVEVETIGLAGRESLGKVMMAEPQLQVALEAETVAVVAVREMLEQMGLRTKLATAAMAWQMLYLGCRHFTVAVVAAV
jgi:hypothetical protein